MNSLGNDSRAIFWLVVFFWIIAFARWNIPDAEEVAASNAPSSS